MKKAFSLHEFCLAWLLGSAYCVYVIPDLKFELIPEGFRVSIPDGPGMKFVAIHGNKNANFTKFGPGEFSGQIREPLDGYWTYENTRDRLENGDKLYLWTNVQVGQVNYRRFEDPLNITNVVGNVESSWGTPLPAVTTRATTLSSSSSSSSSSSPSPPVVEIKEPPPTVGCQPSITVVRNHRSTICRGQLLFEDNFDSLSKLNSTKWQYDIRMPLDKDDAEFVVFDNRPENLYVSQGLLHIVPSLWMDDVPGTDIREGELNLGEKCTGIKVEECKRIPNAIHNVLPSVVSAKIQTKEFFSFKFGRVEVRAKLPQGDWLLPLLLLEPYSHYYGREGFASGQLRIAFARGNTYLINRGGEDISGKILFGGAVLARGSALRGVSLGSIKERPAHYGQEFHVYTLIWTGTRIQCLVDGREYVELSGFQEIFDAQGEPNAILWRDIISPFDQYFFLALGVSAGGHSDFPDGSQTGSQSMRHRKPWRNDHPKAAFNFWKDRAYWKHTWNSEGMQVDYVRVYAL